MPLTQDEKLSAVKKTLRPHLRKWALSVQQGNLKEADQALNEMDAAMKAQKNSPDHEK